jgi:hypothetical protein
MGQSGRPGRTLRPSCFQGEECRLADQDPAPTSARMLDKRESVWRRILRLNYVSPIRIMKEAWRNLGKFGAFLRKALK